MIFYWPFIYLLIKAYDQYKPLLLAPFLSLVIIIDGNQVGGSYKGHALKDACTSLIYFTTVPKLVFPCLPYPTPCLLFLSKTPCKEEEGDEKRQFVFASFEEIQRVQRSKVTHHFLLISSFYGHIVINTSMFFL